MMRGLLVASLVAAAVPAWPQTPIPAGGTLVPWNAGCNASKSFVNKTKRIVCDLTFIKVQPLMDPPTGVPPVPHPNTVHIQDVVLEDGVGNWDVNDDEDRNPDENPNGDGNNENDDSDANPGLVTKINRSGNNPVGRCIAKDATFGIRLCGEDTGDGNNNDDELSLENFVFFVKPTSEAGFDIVAMLQEAPETGFGLIHIEQDETTASPGFAYSAGGINTTGEPLGALTLEPTDSAVRVTELSSTPEGRFDEAGSLVRFSRPVAPEGEIILDFRLSALSAAEVTEIAVEPVEAEEPPREPTGEEQDGGVSPIVIGLIVLVLVVLVAVAVLRRR